MSGLRYDLMLCVLVSIAGIIVKLFEPMDDPLDVKSDSAACLLVDPEMVCQIGCLDVHESCHSHETAVVFKKLRVQSAKALSRRIYA